MAGQLLNWNTDATFVCDLIKAHSSFFKIGVKTKDDHDGIRAWIEYYSAIVGLENLLIFDNMSTDQDTQEFYRSLSGKVMVIQYAGFHNYIHATAIFHLLYETLAKSCEMFAFFDTDERLVLFVDGEYFCKKEISNFLEYRGQFAAFPCTWLDNAVSSTTVFNCGSGLAKLEWGLAWGKPILRTSVATNGIIMHNIQLPTDHYTPTTPLNLFCLHLKNLDPQRRIQVNVLKLVARGFIPANSSIDEILHSSITKVTDPSILTYLNEIRRMMAVDPRTVSQMTSGRIELLPGHRIGWFSDQERLAFEQFQGTERANVIGRVFAARSLV